MSSGKTALVPVADGTEDIELTCITDTLTRCGVAVTTASVYPDKQRPLTLARGLKVLADTTLVEAAEKPWDVIIIPGGMPGAQHIADAPPTKSLLQAQLKTQGQIAAICASPAVVLGSLGLLEGITDVTCFPMMKEKIPKGTNWVDKPVVKCGNLITSQGPGTAILFALSIVEAMTGDGDLAEKVGHQMLVQYTKGKL